MTVNAVDFALWRCAHWDEDTERQVPCPPDCPIQTFMAGTLGARRLDLAVALDDLNASVDAALPPVLRHAYRGWRRILHRISR